MNFWRFLVIWVEFREITLYCYCYTSGSTRGTARVSHCGDQTRRKYVEDTIRWQWLLRTARRRKIFYTVSNQFQFFFSKEWNVNTAVLEGKLSLENFIKLIVCLKTKLRLIGCDCPQTRMFTVLAIFSLPQLSCLWFGFIYNTCFSSRTFG